MKRIFGTMVLVSLSACVLDWTDSGDADDDADATVDAEPDAADDLTVEADVAVDTDADADGADADADADGADADADADVEPDGVESDGADADADADADAEDYWDGFPGVPSWLCESCPEGAVTGDPCGGGAGVCFAWTGGTRCYIPCDTGADCPPGSIPRYDGYPMAWECRDYGIYGIDIHVCWPDCSLLDRP